MLTQIVHIYINNKVNLFKVHKKKLKLKKQTRSSSDDALLLFPLLCFPEEPMSAVVAVLPASVLLKVCPPFLSPKNTLRDALFRVGETAA